MSWHRHLLASLSGRLIVSLSAGIVVTLATWLFFFHILVRNELYDRFDFSLITRLHALANYVVKNPGAEGSAEVMPQYRTQRHQNYFQVWDAAGNVLARAESDLGQGLPRLAAIQARPTFYDVAMPDGHPGRVAVQNFAVPAGDPRQVVTVAMAGEITRTEALEQQLHVFMIVSSLATVALAVTVAVFSVRRSLRPLDALSRSVSAIDLDDPASKLDIEGLPSELKPVADRIQSMTQKLIQAVARERRFARNVAHELRTPLAEARMIAEVGALAEDYGEARSALDEIGRTTQELEQIVESLLSLSRYESGIQKPEPEPVELSAEVHREASRLRDAAQARGLKLEFATPSEAWVQTDAALVRRLVANLIGNAVCHAPQDSTIILHLDADGSFAIENSAPHLEPGDLPRLGERFFRIHSGSGGSHAGLGLSLVQAIAQILDLRFDLDLTGDHRLVARITGFRPLPA